MSRATLGSRGGTSTLPMPFSKAHCRNNSAVLIPPLSNDLPILPILRVCVGPLSWLYRGTRSSIGCAFKPNPPSTAQRCALLLINVSVRETSRPVLFQTPCLWTDSSQPDPGRAFRGPHFPTLLPRASRGMVG
jgi:hypothetical protein